jgi:hypothetical protein
MVCRAWICKLLRSPGIDSASLCSLAGWYIKVISYRPARLGIDSWPFWKVYKFGLRAENRAPCSWIKFSPNTLCTFLLTYIPSYLYLYTELVHLLSTVGRVVDDCKVLKKIKRTQKIFVATFVVICTASSFCKKRKFCLTFREIYTFLRKLEKTCCDNNSIWASMPWIMSWRCYW